MMMSDIRIANPQMAEFLMNSQIKKETQKATIKSCDNSFDEILSEEIRRLDVNYIRTMGILGGN